VNCWITALSKNDFKNVCGLAFLDPKGDMVITPFQDSLEAEKVYDIDWSSLNSDEQTDFFFPLGELAPAIANTFSMDQRVLEPLIESDNRSMAVLRKGR
jgi:hypothetical protein